MKIAHMSDLHYSPGNLAEADRCFTAAANAAIGAGVELAVLSGDATDHALEMQSPALIALARQLRRLTDHCPVLMLHGTYSHEPPGALRLFALLGGRFRLHVAERIEQVALSTRGEWTASPGWRFDSLPADTALLATCIPTVNKAQVAATVGASAAGVEAAALLTAVLDGFGAVNATARASGVVTIGVGHGTVNGCESEHGVPMVAMDHEFTTGALFGAEVDAFMLGHIHRHQHWARDNRLIAYPGSCGRFHFGELGDKGTLHWDVRPGNASYSLIPTPARRTVDLVFAGPPALDEIAAAAADGQLDGAHVRVTWTINEEQAHLVDRNAISAALSGAAMVKFNGRSLPILRARAPGIALRTSVAAKLAVWAAGAGVPPEPLMECLARLDEAEPEDIAASLLRARPPLQPPEPDGQYHQQQDADIDRSKDYDTA